MSLPRMKCFDTHAHAAHDWVHGVNTKHCTGLDSQTAALLTPVEAEVVDAEITQCGNTKPHAPHTCPGVGNKED